MKRKERTIGLVLVIMVVSLLVVPPAAPVAGDEPPVEPLNAVKDDGEDDGDDNDGDIPGKLALYWPGAVIFYAEDPDTAAQDVLERGFTHVVNRPFQLDENRAEWFSAKGFRVIQDISATRFASVAITPRYHSPYEEPTAYAAKLANLEAYLLSHAEYLVGIDDDYELCPWPTKTYYDDGTPQVYPKKEWIANSPDDYDYRIGNADAGSSWTTFKDHPGQGTHDVPDLTMENIQYNFPKLSISQAVVNSQLHLGSAPPQSPYEAGKIAQTFRPEHERITRIDILVARRGAEAPGFPAGQVYFYLTETTDDGKPNESRRLFPVDLRFLGTETDYDAGTDFEGIEPLSLYFDPEEHGLLDTTKTYALVLHFRGQVSDSWYVVASDENDGYSEGGAFRGWGAGEWAAFEGTDIWFKVYYPDPPAGWGLREFHEDWIDFQTDVMKWHIEEYRGVLDRVNASRGTSLELYVYSGYSGELLDLRGRIIGNLHGGFDAEAFYGVDWDKLASAGLDYAVCGFGQPDISMTVADLAGRAVLVGGAQNQEDFNDRWWQCNKKAMLWFGSDDPRVVVPRGRSPESLP